MPNRAAIVVVFVIIYAVVTIMMMITAVSIPLVLAMIPILGIMMFTLLTSHILIFPIASLLVPQVLPLMSFCILAMLFLILTSIILNMSRNLQLNPIMMMTRTATLTLARHPPNLTTHSAGAPLTSAVTQTPKPNNTVTGTTANWMYTPQLG